MFEINMGKDEYLATMKNYPFSVNMVYYKSEKGLTDMRSSTRVCTGYYLDDTVRENTMSVSTVLNSLEKTGKLIKPLIIFDSVNIYRELTAIEKSNRKAIEKFIKCEIVDPEVKIGDIYDEVLRFKMAIKPLKDKERVNKMLPVPVESIAFIEMTGTEGDFILSQEAECIDTWEACTGNAFNIYRLW